MVDQAEDDPLGRAEPALGLVARKHALLGFSGRILTSGQGVENLVAEIAEPQGRSNMSLAAFLALADALGVAPGALLKPAELPEVKRGRPKKSPTS